MGSGGILRIEENFCGDVSVGNPESERESGSDQEYDRGNPDLLGDATRVN